MVALTTTISTPIPLIEYAQGLPEASMTRIFVENMVKQSDLMEAVPFLPATAGKRQFLDISGTPTVSFRGLNAAGNQATGTFNLREEDTFFMDEYIYTDRALVDRLGQEQRLKQLELKSIAISQYFSAIFMKGDNISNSTQPNGLQVRCNNPMTSGKGNLLYNSTSANGAVLSLGNLDLLYWQVNKPTHWIFPRTLMPYVDIAARNTSLVNQSFTYDNVASADGGKQGGDFGRRIAKYKGLPILFGYMPDDTPDMLPMTEIAYGGGTATTGSIYCVSLRDGGIYAIEQTPMSVVDEGIVPGQPQYSHHVKWDWGIAREHPYSVARLSSIAIGTIVA